MTGSIITIHMVASVDGFIAKHDNSIEWMSTQDHYDQGIDEASIDVEAFLQGIDCYVMGARTYEHALALGWPYGDKPVYVLTNRELPKQRETVFFHSGDLVAFTGDLRLRYTNIWMVGGAALTRELLRLKLADDIRLTILPIILGDGIPFFDQVAQQLPLHLKEVSPYRNGMVELWYQIRKD